MAIERLQIRLPQGFDPARHGKALPGVVAKAHGEGWEVESIAPERGVATLTRQSMLVEVVNPEGVAQKAPEAFEIKLPGWVKLTDGDKFAARQADANPGYHLIKFEPHLGRAVMGKMSEPEFHCREAVANVLGVKPWDVTCRQGRDKGYTLQLPIEGKGRYTPAKHDTKLQEVAEQIVGQFGWYFTVDTRTMVCRIIPSAPPTFPEMLRLDVKQLGKGDLHKTPFGLKLPRPGEIASEAIAINWKDQAFALISGLPGSGKFLAHSTRVPVPIQPRFPDGWAQHGNLRLGDLVYGFAGRPVEVDHLEPEQDMALFEVVFGDGQVVLAGAEHLWTVSSRRSRTANEQPAQIGKRSAAVSRFTAEQRRLRSLAAELCGSKTGADSATIAQMAGVGLQTMRTFLSESAVPHVKLPGKGSPRAYPADEVLVAWADHLARTRSIWEGSRLPLLTTVTTAEMAARLRVEDGRANWAVPMPSAVDGVTEPALPIPPYTFGAWLGDGTARAGAITIGQQDEAEMLAWIESDLGWSHHRREACSGGSASAFHFGRPRPERCDHDHDAWVVTAGGARYCRDCRTVGSTRDQSNASLGQRLATLGVRNDKRIPAAYLRAGRSDRLSLLQGLMDTDGTVDRNGCCELTLCDDALAGDALELIRSLGIKASMTTSDAAYTLGDVRKVTGVRHRISFTTGMPVFRLTRKAARLPGGTRSTSAWNYVVDIRPAGRGPVRCIRVNDPQHLYLVEGFIPTHNTVTLNNLISDQLANGAELIVVDDPAKAVDFTWAKPFVRDGGWGCGGLRSAVTALMLMYEEGQRRAEWMAEHGYVNWFDIPERQRFKPILAVVDEVAALLVTEKLPPGVDKNLPEVQEIIEENRLRFKLQRRIQKVIAEQRFVGMRMILASQVTNQNTGLPPTLKSLIGHKMLQGTNPSKVQRDQAFNVSANVPFVPENLRGGGNVAKGVGAAELEAQPPAIYKSFFATTDDLSARLRQLGVRVSPRPEPSDAEMDRLCPVADDDLDGDTEPLVAGGGQRLPSGKPLSSLPPEFGPQANYGADGKRLRGAAAAQAAGAKLAKQAAQMVVGADPDDDRPLCPSCDQPIQLNGECGCSF